MGFSLHNSPSCTHNEPQPQHGMRSEIASTQRESEAILLAQAATSRNEGPKLCCGDKAGKTWQVRLV